MSDEKQIRIGVDPSGMKSGTRDMLSEYDKLKSKVQELSKLSGDAYKKEQEDLKKTIELLEKKNRLEYDRVSFRNKAEYKEAQQYVKSEYANAPSGVRSTAEITAFSSYKGEQLRVSGEFQQQREQTKILRDLLDAVKQTSKEEIRQEKIDDDNIRGLVAGGYGGFARDVEKEDIKKDKEVGAFGKRAVNEVANVAGARNGLDIASGAAKGAAGVFEGVGGVGGISGMIAALAVGKLISTVGESVSRFESSYSGYSRFGDASTQNIDKIQFGKDGGGRLQMSKYGLTASDYFNNLTALRGGAKTNKIQEGGLDYEQSATNLMNITKGTPLSQSDVTGLLSLKRFGGGNVSPEVEFFKRFLSKTGQDMSALPEIIQQFTQATNTLVRQTGRANTYNAATLYGGFQAQTGLTGEVASSNFNKMEQGFHMSNDPVLASMQLRAARRAGAKSFWQARKMTESPMSHPEYMKNYMEGFDMWKGENKERAITDAFGTEAGLADKLKRWKGTGYDIRRIPDDPNSGSILNAGSVDFSKAAERTTGKIEASGKYLEATREEYGYKAATAIADATSKLADKVMELVDMFTDNPASMVTKYGAYGEQYQKEYQEKFKKNMEDLKNAIDNGTLYGKTMSDSLKRIEQNGIYIKEH